MPWLTSTLSKTSMLMMLMMESPGVYCKYGKTTARHDDHRRFKVGYQYRLLWRNTSLKSGRKTMC